MNGWMIFLLLLQVAFNTAAQLLLKRGMMDVGELNLAWQTIYNLMLKIITSPFIIVGCSFYVFSLLCCLIVLSRIQVSVAYPIGSLGYVLSALTAYYFLGERLTSNQWLGIAVIILGVFLLVRDL